MLIDLDHSEKQELEASLDICIVRAFRFLSIGDKSAAERSVKDAKAIIQALEMKVHKKRRIISVQKYVRDAMRWKIDRILSGDCDD